MKLREITRYEIQHRLRSPSTWIYAVFLLFIAFAMIHVDADGSSPTHVNAPSRLALLSVMAGMVGMLISAAFFGDAALRDHEVGMDSLLFTTPLNKIDYLGGRFLGALIVNAALLLAVPIGNAIATQMPYLDRVAFGPFDVWAYIQNYLLLLLPNLIFSATILFAVGVLTRKTIPVYLVAIGIFVSYVIVVNLPPANAVANVLTDPSGLRVLHDLTERWTPFERNSRLLGGSASILLNRAVWLAIAGGAFALLCHRFKFAYATISEHAARRTVSPSLSAGVAPQPGFAAASPATVPLAHVDPTFGLRTSVRQTFAVARRGFAEIAASPTFVLIFVALIGLTVIMGWDAGEGVFDTSTTPLTILIFERISQTPLVPITYLLVALFAGELVWRNRDDAMAEIADAAPVSEGSELTGRFLALVALLALLRFPTLIGGVILQAAQGYFHFEIALYLKVLFGMQMADLIPLAGLALLVHVLVNHKYLGHLAVFVAFISVPIIRSAGWIQHHLLLYATDPGWKYSNMNGFGPFLRAAVWFKSYWAVWGVLLVVVAALFWVRGRESGVRARLLLARERFGGPLLRAGATTAGIILLLGGFIFYNTNVLNEYTTKTGARAPQARYEKLYRRYLDTPQPTIVAAAIRVELHPERAAAEMKGTYTLVNRTTSTIDSLHVFTYPTLAVQSISLAAARPTMVDSSTGYRIYRLEHPLAPGDSMSLAFDVRLERKGFTNDPPTGSLAENGTWIDRRYLPFIGYQPALELDAGRGDFGLGEQKPLPTAANPGDAIQHQQIRNDADLVDADVVIGTSGDQTGFTAGQLRRSWTENGRHYFEYETSPPNSMAGGYFSARYAVEQAKWHDVTLRIFHDPNAGEDVDRMMRGLKAALDYCSSNFAPYPDSSLSIVEVPRYSVFGIALPTSMAFSEDAFHSRVRQGEIDQPFYGVAHETAHHWWGGMANPAPVRGAGLLSESLANYTAMMVMEKAFGREVAQRVYRFQMDRYFSGRGEYSREAPMVDVGSQPYLSYRKGAVALYTMRDMIGEEAMNKALHSYVMKFRHDGPPYPTSLDLVAELRAVTPDSLQSLVTDLFETVTLWEVKEDSATVTRTADGKYAVTMDVQARKVRADSIGREHEIPMNDLVEIGVFARGKDGALGEPLYLHRQRIHSGKQRIRVVVDREPDTAGIDPYDKVIDRDRGDNMRSVKESS